MSEYSKDYTIDEMMTVLMAREVRNDDVMIVGVAPAFDESSGSVLHEDERP